MKRIITIVVIVVVVAAGATAAYRHMSAPNPSSETQYKLAEAVMGSARKTVTATGVLTAWANSDIKSKAGGAILKMYADEGDFVHKGQVLAVIDPTDTLLSVQQDRANLNSARAKTQQSEEAWRLQLAQTANGIQSAAAALANAKANLANARVQEDKARSGAQYQPALWAAGVGDAQANLDSTQKGLDQLLATNKADLANAKSASDQAHANLFNAQVNDKRQKTLLAKGYVTQQAVDAADAAYEVALAQVNSADATLHTIGAQQAAAVASARAKVMQAKAQLETARAQEVQVVNARQAVDAAIAARKQAEAQVNQQQVALNQAKASVLNNPIQKLNIAQAKASVAYADAAVRNSDITLSQTKVVAPYNGVILTKYVNVGTIVPSALGFAAVGNAIYNIGDVSRMYVDVQVDETDYAGISMGMPVDMTFDAYPTMPFDGKVMLIEPHAVIDNNVTDIHVRVEVDNTSIAYRLLKPGMNATCQFVEEEKDNVLTVPSEAVHTGDDGGRYVEVGRGGHKMPDDPSMLVGVKVERRTVEVGIEGDVSTEITSGLKAGEKVVTAKIEPVAEGAGSPFGGRRH